ncbi:MAG: hypothetical protein M3151_02625 [Actinomycetota bacterium]|nr:hypothetical protein [Actinomycetota bacterium]
MSDSRRPSERGIERDLEDLGARIEYPPTPDLALAVRRRLDEEEGHHSPGRSLWQSMLSPRWAAPAAALVLIAFALLSPAVRETLSGPFSGQPASPSGGQASQAGGSAARPESGGSEAGPSQQAKAGPEAPVAGDSRGEDRPASGGGSVAPQSSMAESAGGESAQAVGCPAPHLEAEPARAASGGSFRLRGNNFASSCERLKPAQGVRLAFRQGGKTWKLATVDADRSLAFDAGLRVPAGAEPGRASVQATTRSGGHVEERFVVLR